MFAFVKKLVLVLVLFALLLFLYENLEVLSTKIPFVFDLFVQGYRYKTPELPVWILFALFFLFGMLTAGFHGVYERLARTADIRRRDKKIRALEKELSEARSRLADLKPAAQGPTPPSPAMVPVPAPPRPEPPAGASSQSNEEEPTL